mgnify:FL=1
MAREGQNISLLAGGLSGSMGADLTSRTQNILAEPARHGSLTIEWSAGATPVGVGYVRGTNNPSATSPTWENIPGLVYNLSGDSGVQTFILEDVALSYEALDFFYDRTSGDGTMDRIDLLLKD